jgi:GGDEF domain-containing protein
VVLHGINGTQATLSAAQRLLDLLGDPVDETLILQVVAGAAVAPLHSETPEGLVKAAKNALTQARNSKETNAMPFFQEGHT